MQVLNNQFDSDQKHPLNTLRNIANAPLGTRWYVSPQGEIEQASLGRRISETFRGWVGLGNRTKTEVFEKALMQKINEGLAQGVVDADILRPIYLSARHAGLILGKPQTETKHIQLVKLLEEVVIVAEADKKLNPDEFYKKEAERITPIIFPSETVDEVKEEEIQEESSDIQPEELQPIIVVQEPEIETIEENPDVGLPEPMTISEEVDEALNTQEDDLENELDPQDSIESSQPVVDLSPVITDFDKELEEELAYVRRNQMIETIALYTLAGLAVVGTLGLSAYMFNSSGQMSVDSSISQVGTKVQMHIGNIQYTPPVVDPVNVVVSNDGFDLTGWLPSLTTLRNLALAVGGVAGVRFLSRIRRERRYRDFSDQPISREQRRLGASSATHGRDQDETLFDDKEMENQLPKNPFEVFDEDDETTRSVEQGPSKAFYMGPYRTAIEGSRSDKASRPFDEKVD